MFDLGSLITSQCNVGARSSGISKLVLRAAISWVPRRCYRGILPRIAPLAQLQPIQIEVPTLWPTILIDMDTIYQMRKKRDHGILMNFDEAGILNLFSSTPFGKGDFAHDQIPPPEDSWKAGYLHMSHVVNYRVLSHDLRLHSNTVLKVLPQKR